MEEMLKELISLGPIGVITAYFLWNDHQDRKAYREELKNNRATLSEHEIRIKMNEVAIHDIKEKVMQ